MICCLNPHCPKANPSCPDGTKFCSSCRTEMVLLSDRYRPIKRLGEGGFGVTYLAEDNNRFNKHCVIKQLTLKIPDAQRLFEGEARRLEELADYPAIPRLLSYYSDTNYLYLVQEFVEGQDLSKELDEKGVFNEVAVKDFLNAVLPILEVIHKQGIIHRDIKLDNMMRRSDGKIVLIDFGIAKIIAENNTITPGTRAGTNGYAAPEQMKDGLATPSSDLYSLGAACFYLLTNLSPSNMFMDYGYQWTTNWRQHLKQPIDQKLDAIIDKLLKPNYKDRYQSASEVLASLNSQALQSAPTAISNDSNIVTKIPQQFTLVQGAILGVIITIGLTIGAFFIAVFCIAFYTISSANDHIKAGDALLSKDKEAAIRKYNKAIEIADYSDEAYAHRGSALFSLGRKKDALKDYNKAIEINSGSSEYYYERGNVVAELGDNKGAIKDYDQAIKHKSNYPEALNNRGNSKFALGDKQGAIEDYNQAIKLKSDYAIPYYNRGNVKFSMGDKRSANDDYSTAISFDDNYGDAYYNRGNSWLDLGDRQRASQDYRKASELYQKQGKTQDYKNASKSLKKLGQ